MFSHTPFSFPRIKSHKYTNMYQVAGHKRSYLRWKRILDIVFAFLGLIFLLPLFLLISLLVMIDNPGRILFLQERVGRYEKTFRVIKFRTMKKDAHKKGLITLGSRDKRITRTGYFLRRYKLDEIPQVWNIIRGDMSFVGPRPEVKKYMELLSAEEKRYLAIRPGLTSLAALEYLKVNELLASSRHPEQTYIGEVMPAKLAMNLKYLEDMGFRTDLRILLRTIPALFNRFH